MSEPAPSSAHRAIFLSYAREDAPATRRIAEALRAFGLEVWFDQNELRGGDAWDQKIRNQIKDCALFIPVISETTQARNEGYFRREWRLAVDRTHDMAAGRTFLLPVVIDDTLEGDALVPEEFLKVQWMRISGAPSPEFVILVKQILETPAKPAGRTRPPTSAHSTPPTHVAVTKKSGFPAWMWGVLIIFAAVIGVVAFRPKHEAIPATTTSTTVPAVAAPAQAKPAEAAVHVEEKSVAVLPFENMSEEKDASAFFADGVHEDLLTNLSLIRDLHVVSRTSVMQYRSTTKSIRQIAQELGVAYILEGSVRRSGNKVRVTGQLIRAANDEHVWAKSYDRDLTDVFAIQGELSQAIAQALAAAISPEEKKLLERRPTESLAAYDSYLRAHQIGETATAEGTQDAKVISLLTDAVRLDPKFAQAWAELGRHHAFVHFNEVDPSPERLVKAREAIETAIRLAPDAPEVIENYGDYFYYAFRDYARAAEQYQRLAVIRPNDPAVFGSLALIHRREGRDQEALAEFHRAIELDPRSMRYLQATQQLAQALNLYDEAMALQQRVVALVPGDLTEAYNAAVIPFLARGSTQEAKEWFSQVKPTAEQREEFIFIRKQWDIQVGDWSDYIAQDKAARHIASQSLYPPAAEDLFAAFAFQLTGDKDSARRRAQDAVDSCVEELKVRPSAGFWTTLGGAYAILGRNDEARAAAKKAVDLIPESIDAVNGVQWSLNYAGVLGWTGDKDTSLRELARLLRTPFAENIYEARGSPLWYPLHGDPRFEALVHDPKNNEPIR